MNIIKGNSKFKGKRFKLMWITVGFLAFIISIATIYFISSLTTRQYKERQIHLQEITVKVSEVLDANIAMLQDKATSAKRQLAKNSAVSSGSRVCNVLENIAYTTDIENGVLMALGDDGKYYTSDHNTGIWENLDDLVTDNPMPVIREIGLSDNNIKTSYMVFFGKLDNGIPITNGDSKIIQTAVLVPLDTMAKVFIISGFEGQCYTYLVNNEGRRLYKQTFSNDFIEDYNVLTALEADSFHMDSSITELKDAVKNREQLSVEFTRAKNNEDYFVATVPLSNSNWTVLLFVPTNVLGANTGSFMTFVVTYFVIVTIAMIAVFGFLIYAVATNKNDRRLLQQQEQSNELLFKAAEEARSANAAKSEFLSHMSHDIRTPINGIVGMTNIAMKNQDSKEKVVDCLHKISSSADHLLTLVNDVLDMSRIESGKVVIAHDPMDIRTVIDNCYSIISGQILEREVNFYKDFKIQHPHVLGDELHTRQVLINILGNAIKFTPDGGTIHFRAKEITSDDGKGLYRFEIEDNGIGMSEDFQKHIFEAFSQADNGSRTTYMGTGLGMAITKQFVDLMNGTISIKSKLSEGSKFTVDITLDIDQSKILGEEEIENDNVSGMKVLLVEDNMLNMEIAEEILEDEKVVVSTAENGEIAFNKFTASTPGTYDAILMDIMMPVMNGLEATKAIRASNHPEAKTIPIIAMTANAYAEDVHASLEAGMNAHIAKPINIPILLSTLNRYRVKKN